MFETKAIRGFLSNFSNTASEYDIPQDDHQRGFSTFSLGGGEIALKFEFTHGAKFEFTRNTRHEPYRSSPVGTTVLRDQIVAEERHGSSQLSRVAPCLYYIQRYRTNDSIMMLKIPTGASGSKRLVLRRIADRCAGLDSTPPVHHIANWSMNRGPQRLVFGWY